MPPFGPCDGALHVLREYCYELLLIIDGYGLDWLSVYVPVMLIVTVLPSWDITKVPTWTSFPAFRRLAIKLPALTCVITVASKSGKPVAGWGCPS